MLCANSCTKKYVDACRSKEADFARLSVAFLAEIEAKYL
jgi:hypothetical protein